MRYALIISLFSTVSFSMEEDQEFKGFQKAVQINYALGGKFDNAILNDKHYSEEKKTYAVMEAVRYGDMSNLNEILPHPDVYEKHLRQLNYPEATIKEEVSNLEKRNDRLKQEWREED